MVTEEARRAEVAKKVAELDKQFEDEEKARTARRAKNAEERRANADRASARAAAGAGTAEEKRARGEMSRRIADATTAEELDKAQQDLDAMRRRAKAADKEAGVVDILGGVIDDPGNDSSDPEVFRKLKDDAIAAAEARISNIELEGAGMGMSEKDIAAYRQSEQRLIDTIKSAETYESLARAVAKNLSAREEITAARGANAVDAGGSTAVELDQQAAKARNQADASAERNQRQQAEADRLRALKAEDLRVKAAEARRGGDEPAAKRLEESAKALETAVDALEGAALQQEINQQRQALAAEQELRAQQAEAGGKAAMATKELDSVGGFMSSAFDRLGYSSNLAERQAKAAEAGAAGIAKLVGFAERGGLFV
jgi:hypothetical protein